MVSIRIKSGVIHVTYMSNNITWVKQIPQYRNYQLLLASILVSIFWVVVFFVYFFPFDPSDTRVVLAFAGGGFVAGVALPGVDSAKNVSSIASLRYMFWLAAGSVLAVAIITVNPLWLGAGVSGGILGYAISMGIRSISQNETVHIIVIWNIFLIFWIIGLGGLMLSGLHGGTPALAGFVVAFVVLVSQHQMLEDEVGVKNGS